MASVVISPHSFLILFIWVLSLFFLVSLARGLLILFTLSKNPLLVLQVYILELSGILPLPPDVFNQRLIESLDVETMDIEGWLYF